MAPGGLEEVFAEFGSPTGLCDPAITELTVVTPGPIAVPDTVQFYVCGSSDETLLGSMLATAAIQLPDSTVRNMSIPGFWTSLPGDPYGDYTITVTYQIVPSEGAGAGPAPSGAAVPAAPTPLPPRTLTGTFTVVPAPSPRMLTVNDSVAAGGAVSFALGGFAPHSSVTLHLFRGPQGERRMSFATTLPLIQVDARGEALYTLATTVGDPPGTYCLVFASAETPPPDGECDAVFFVG